MNNYKITKTNNRSDRRSVRCMHDKRKCTGWETVWSLAFKSRLPVEDFVRRYSPGVYSDHVEFSTTDWTNVCRKMYGADGESAAGEKRLVFK